MSSQREAKPVDTSAMVQYCLSCPFPECWNCLGRSNAYSYGIRMELDERFREKETRAILKAAMERKEAKENV